MGASKGLNILPHKSWHVYNRENREKVLRDEAAHEEELCRLREKQDQADREHRRNILLQRARRRHGGAVVVNLDANNTDSEARETVTSQNTLPEGDAWTTHDLGSPANVPSIVHEDVDRCRNESFFSSLRASESDRNGDHGEGPMSLLNSKIERDASPPLPTKSLRAHPDRASVGSKDVRARESASLYSAAGYPHTVMQTDDASSSPRWHDDAKTTSILSHHRSDVSVAKKKIEHINLFAEEEARARNPERSEEDRVARRRRGDAKTQTTDSKFDEKFGFAYGLTGRGAVPWYASSSHQKRDRLQQQQEDDDERFGASQRIRSEAAAASARMEEWKRRGEEALIEHHRRSKPASVTEPARKENDVAGVDGLPNESDSVIDTAMLSDMQRKKRKGNGMSLLGSVRIISSTERDSKGAIKKGGSSMNGDSIVPSRVHGEQDHVENRRKPDDRVGNEPERKTKEKKRRRSDVHGGGEASGRHNADGSASYKSIGVQDNDKWRALREERMKREAEERKRERETIRKALNDAAADEERSGNRRYHSGYGYGR